MRKFTIGPGCSVQTRHRHPFFSTAFEDLSAEVSVENPIVMHGEEDKENAPPPPSTPESVRPMEPPRLQGSRTVGARVENVPYFLFRNLFQ